MPGIAGGGPTTKLLKKLMYVGREISPLMILLPFQFDGELTPIDKNPVTSTSIGWLPRVRFAEDVVALSSLMRSNPVKVASWSTRKVPLPINARTSVPAPPVRLSPAFSVAAVADTVEPEEGVTIVSLPVVRPTTPAEGGGGVYVPLGSTIFST